MIEGYGGGLTSREPEWGLVTFFSMSLTATSFGGMSMPICSRCQKMYTAGSAPAKCVNCGGDVKVPGAATKPVTQTAPKSETRTNPNAEAGNQPGVPRSCSKKMCLGIAENTVQHLSDRKQIILRPITSVPVPGAEYICLSHTLELNAPPGWRLIKQFPNSNEKVVKAPTTSQVSTPTSSEGSGCFDVFAAIFGFIILAAMVIGAGWLVIEFFSWLSSGTGGGGGGDGSNQPFRMPRWRRR